MWCSNTSCGVEGTGSFCQQCGARMVKFRSIGAEETMCCSDPSCGYEGTGNFCQQCGAKMITYITVTCSGKLEDGSPCHAELVPSKNFCSNCGAKVDKSVFLSRPTKTICQKCGTELEKGSLFCSHCGQKQSKQDVEAQQASSSGKSCDIERKKTPENTDKGKDKLVREPSNLEKSFINDSKQINEQIETEQATDLRYTVKLLQETDVGGNSKTVNLPQMLERTALKPHNQINLEILDQKKKDDQTSVEIQTQNESNVKVLVRRFESNKLLPDSESDSKSVSTKSKPKHNEDVSQRKQNNENNDDKKSEDGNNSENKMKSVGKSAENGLEFENFAGDAQEKFSQNYPTELEKDTQNELNENESSESKGVSTGKQEEKPKPKEEKKTQNSEQNAKNKFQVADVISGANDIPKSGCEDVMSCKKVHTTNPTEEFPADTPSTVTTTSTVTAFEPGPETQPLTPTTHPSSNPYPVNQSSNSPDESGSATTGPALMTSATHVTASNENTQNKADPNSGTCPRVYKEENVTHVIFHAIISEDFRFDPDKHKLILCMEEQNSKWDTMSRICRVKKKLNDHVYEMEFVLKIPRYGGWKTQYKYCIFRPEKTEKEQYIWEDYYQNGVSGKDANRSLVLTEKRRDTDVLHQYDGYIIKEPSTWKKVRNLTISWKKELVKYAQKGVDYFCSSIFEAENSHSMAWCLDQLETLLDCFKRIYYIDAMCWDSKKESFNAEIGGNVLKKMLAIAGSYEDTVGLSEEKRERQVAISIAAINFAKQLDIPFADLKSWQNICKSMIIIPDRSTKKCLELQTLDKYFPKKRIQLLEAIIALARHIANNSKNPSWLFLMPWIHFLSGLCNPFDPPPYDEGHNNKDPVWWGVTQIGDNFVKCFEGKKDKWQISIEETLAYLEPIFEMDFYLPRTFITAIRLEELNTVIKTGMIPIEVCIASLFYQVKKTRPISHRDHRGRYYFDSFKSDDERVVEECLNELKTSLNRPGQAKTPCNTHQEKMSCYFSTQLLIECTKTNRALRVCHSVGIMLHCLSVYAEKSEDQEKYAVSLFNRCIAETKVWVNENNFNWETYMEVVLETWNGIYSPVDIEFTKITDMWNQEISKALSEVIQTMVFLESRTTKSFVELYCEQLDSYNLAMQDCLSKAAFKAIERGYAVDYARFKSDGIRRLGSLLSKLFLKEWGKYAGKDDKKDILEHFLGWPPFAHFVKIYSKDQKQLELLSSECLERLLQAISAVENCIDLLFKGEITIGTLRLIQSNEVNFVPIAENLKKAYSKNRITKAVQIRQMEIEAFRRQAELMTTLTSLCQHIRNVDSVDVDRILSKLKDFDSHTVNEFCKPADVKRVETIETFQPTLCAFQVSQEVLTILPDLKRCSESNVFMKFWIAKCQSLEERGVTLSDVVKHVWVPAKSSWDKEVRNIKTGDIKFQEFESLLGKLYKEEYDKIEGEMKILGIPDSIIRERVDQLKKFRQLHTCTEGAKTILKFAKVFNLKGDFQQIKSIALNDEDGKKMKSFDDSVIQACDFLLDLNKKRVTCLNTLTKCMPLVHWLRSSMRTAGLKELKVFVDLAFMSAGDEPINIKRVQCLHSAVTGYAPIIFELEEISGYKDLLELCARVWNELDANPALPKMLTETNRQLQWLKDVQKAHGSVEVTSLMQAGAINENGIYTVGKRAWNKHTQRQEADSTLLVVADIVKLTVPEKEGQRQLRNYTFSQIQDLQSRLMLVAGKADSSTENVEKFTMIFDSITRLSKVYLKLCSSGCVLFKDFTARFYPSPNRPVCMEIDFGQGDNAPQLKGRRSLEENLKDMIPELAKFMETCLEDWLHFIKAKRRSYLYLNYFTVDQLVILQRELVKISTTDTATHLIYPLLSAVKENCSKDDIIEAMTAAKQEIENAHSVGRNDMIRNQEPVVNLEASVERKRQQFIRELVENGYDETLANRALDILGPEDVVQGLVWCATHEGDYQPIPELQNLTENPAHGPIFTGWSQSTMDIQTTIATHVSGLRNQENVGSKPLIDELNALWRMFLDSISSNLRDYLSLEHLGLILKYLSRKGRKQVCRSLPPGLKEGQPNLVICPSADVLMSTLSLYSSNEDQPLPQPDEVLMCTSMTSKDEIDIFWLRAIFDTGKKIHCLVNAEMLDYDISEAAERCLDEYLQDVHFQGLKYRLVLICGSDNEYRSGIVASLDRFKRQRLPTNIPFLRGYLLKKLTIQHKTWIGVEPAASVDRERSSVRVIKSCRAGVGKTLFKKRQEEKLLGKKVKTEIVSIPLQEKTVDLHRVVGRFLEHTISPGQAVRLFHIDITHEVQNGVDYLLFNLLVLGCLVDKRGFVWRKLPTDIYLVETIPLMMISDNRKYVYTMLGVLPDLTCRSPRESEEIYKGLKDYNESDQLFDEVQFNSQVFQRTFQYLSRLENGRKFEDVNPQRIEGTPQTCLQTLLRHCGLMNPSWSELQHFVWFLNTQLLDFEMNSFLSRAAEEDLPGFSEFVLRFLLSMSRDFSTRSLNMSEESPGKSQVVESADVQRDDLTAYQMRRTWESSPHPYIFFNSDRLTFTFLGFFIDRETGNLIDSQTTTVLERGIMKQNLYDSLVRNQAPLQENFDELQRDQKIMKLCNVMGIELPHDPDDTYELTTDNVKKIMAIYMRFRCDIPVIIMGETGCGKTRLVKFMCALQKPCGSNMTNMILMKVHGGTTNKDIIRKVGEAEKLARFNRENFQYHGYTVLFFDEANTTETIGLIKEIMCDRSMEGKRLQLCENLKFVAACNPYRKHSDQLIRKLEQAGLGYHVDADETEDRLGRVPMRRLVYRVQPLPQSLLPLVWDFGQLNTHVEDLYIRQMVKRYVHDKKLPDIPNLKETVSAVLTASQDYMRAQKDECSFVSLRDVDRVLTVMSWFYQMSQEKRTLYGLMDQKRHNHVIMDIQNRENQVDDVTRSLILALGVCYHACLKTRPQYRAHVARFFRAPCLLPGGANQINVEIECCQDVFLENVLLEKNIARNMALKENVFMMVVCIELRIPLFLLGKPGSSKSLAKTIVSDAMQGNAARQALFRELKQTQMISYQCSPLSTPDGIVGTFRQCAQFQMDKDLNTFVSIVVLDEVGLAEDSPRMPLKTLHPLLEDGCQGDEKPEKHKKVAFIGISNWALDPAKMNRGILVQREVPDLVELINSASGICQTDDDELENLIKPLIEPMAKSYLKIFDKAAEKMREFFGLRDFYSLVKMVYGFVERSKQKPTCYEMLHAIKRNFGGIDQVDPVVYFREHLSTLIPLDTRRLPGDPDCTPSGLIQACLFDRNIESRYLLLLTENYGALSIIQQQILSRGRDIHPIIIFGSNFRSDQEYTQVCRNINKIKVCMETGNTVVLLNLENLYESLYDALNQYYVYFGGERYVDLGLGTHRVKCPVHKNFRLIVVAEKQTVYKKFPIPLINRLEKHLITINTMLTPEQQNVVKKLEEWTKQFVRQMKLGVQFRQEKDTTKVGDVFIGYHDDTCSAIVLDEWEKTENMASLKDREDQVLQASKFALLWCATPESIVRLKNSGLSNEEKMLLKQQYFDRQQHDSIFQYLQHYIGQEKQQLFTQVTTHSKLLAGIHKSDISQATGIDMDKILLLETLPAFDTEQQFTNRVRLHMQRTGIYPSLMVIQCDSGDINANLIACARFCVIDEFQKTGEELRSLVNVVFIVQLPRGANFTGFQCGVWHSVHIDELYTEERNTLALRDMLGRSVAGIFSDAVTKADDTETAHDIEINNSSPQHETDGDGVKSLILNCVQAALSMVKDRSQNLEREISRVSLVFRLINEETDSGQFSFINGVCNIIAKLLKEKESKTLLGAMAEYWMINEAASDENITKAATFRGSCLQVLEGKVSPILAGIIAYLDTNENLSILEEEQSTWKREFWLRVLNCSDALKLELSDLLSPAKQSDLHEVFVVTTGCENHMFRAKMPFSWLLMNQINDILTLTKPSGGLRSYEEERTEIGRRIDSSVRILGESPTGRLLSSNSDDQSVIEAVKEYVEDFVHTIYNAGSDQEHKLVVQLLYVVASQMGEHTSLLHGLVHVHIAYETLGQRLTYFRAINSIWPECSSVIVDLRTKKPDHFMFKEQDIIFSALCLLIENLTPKEADLNKQQGRSNWLSRVHQYRPIVEKILGLDLDDIHLYGKHSLVSARRAKCLWSRVMVVKLFLENICTVDKEDNITIKQCMVLWQILGEETDLKDMRSLTGVENVLKMCNKQARRDYLGPEEKCCRCESFLEGPPITLPCKDVLCDQCYDDMRSLGETTCGKCHKTIHEKWEPAKQAANKAATEGLKDFQKRCNTFFMEVVSQLCFADSTAPSMEVLDKLLSYIFFTTRTKLQRTKELTIFDTGIDPNPVFRSFLLQLLMRTSKNSVMENLSRYFEQADGLIRTEKGVGDQHYVELSLLVIQCLENMFAQEVCMVNTDEVEYAMKALKNAKQRDNVGSKISVEKLYVIANARIGLAIVAKYIADIAMNDSDPKQTDYRVKNMIEMASVLCDNASIKWYRVYLVKYLCRRYGIDLYRAICRKEAPFLRCIRDKDLNQKQVVEGPDRFIVADKNYLTVRESVTKTVLGEDITHLINKLQELEAKGVKVEPILHLALYREVTCSNLYPKEERERKVTLLVYQNIEKLINSCQMIKNKQSLCEVIRNQLVPRNLVLKQGEHLHLQGIQCLIFHFRTVMTHLQGEGTLLQPLVTLINVPQSMSNAYLPTMPQNDLDELKATFKAVLTKSGENAVFYKCPNNHLYMIGNCGNPNSVGMCPVCKEPIGGLNHTLSSGNTRDDRLVGPETGHILGSAQARSRDVQPERELTPAYCSAVRMLLHIAMYLGAGTNRTGVHQLIKPNVMENQVEDFVWEHILKDVDDMQTSLGVSKDDVILLMHTVMKTIFKMHKEGDRVATNVCQWNSKDGRRTWETNFSSKFLDKVVKNKNQILTKRNQQLANDQRLGTDPLLCLLYETDTNAYVESAAMIEMVPRVWRYHIPISLQHLCQELQAKPNQHDVLKLFLQEEPNLRAIRYIPSILRLHRALFKKYQRKLDKTEASQITVARLRKEKFAGEETQLLLHDFSEAWELVRGPLKVYLCATEKGREAVSKEYCIGRISDHTTVEMLLPTTKEAGLCSYALVDLLLRKQNEFLDKYLRVAQRTSISAVQPRDVTSAHLISYDPQHDIMPLIYANCHYLFEMGKGTKIEYDFAGLERQLIDRLLFSKSMIDVGKVLQIDLMVYRTELTNAEVFKKLADKIPQETLGTVVKTQIIGEFRSLPDICRSLDNLNITIGFLKSTGGPQDRRLNDFMVKTLQMKSPIHSLTAQQVCELRHARALWLLLSLQKSKKMTDSNQPSKSTFESVSVEFHEDLPKQVFVLFKEYALKKLSVEKLNQLVEVLHEYILVVVAVRQNPDDEDYTNTTDNKLKPWLEGYVDGCEPPTLDKACLVAFPENILYKHSVHTWVSAYSFLKQKQTGKM